MTISSDEFNIFFPDMNPWWNIQRVPKHLTGIPRNNYIQELQSKLSVPEVIIISGMRHTGKTTIMYQLIQDLIDDGTPPKHIFYIQYVL